MDREQDIPFVYENGEFRFQSPLNLPEGARGFIHVNSSGPETSSPRIDPQELWTSKSIDELAAEQGIVGPTNLDGMHGDWPAEESIDEFLDQVRKGRR